ncbi:MAG TPA: CHAT domain-containing protein [Anaerolineales bacterium]
MDARSYTDFDLVIEQSGDKYRARVISSPAGQAAVEFDGLFSPLEVENFVLRMGRPKRGMRRIDSSEMETIRIFGGKLFRTVFSNEVLACYMRSIDTVLRQNKGLRIRLRINVPEFHDLPWEFLYNPQVDQFLALSKDTPIVRYMELPYSTQALAVKAPMKILVMISSPAEYPPLDVEEEWRRLNRALQPLIDQGLVVLRRLEKPTLGALQQQLRREAVHIFHFIGHGKYFERQQDGMLLLEDESGRGRPTSGQHLGALLHDHHTLQLVVLNACEGARTSSDDPYTGVAQTLVRQGIPAVLANQFEIFEDAAVTLAQEFYGALADGYPVDAALSEARKAIFASDNDVEWGTPVLFMRIPNGVLFKTKPAATGQLAAEKELAARVEREPEQKKKEDRAALLLQRLYDQARNQMLQGDWPAAIDLLGQIHEIDPEFRDVESLLEEAQAEGERAKQAAALLAQARESLQAGDDPSAIPVLEELLNLAPTHMEAQQLLGSAKARLTQRQEAEREQHERNAELSGLDERARAEKARLEELDRLTAGAAERMAQQDWTGSIKLLSQALALEPALAGARSMLADAERGQQVKSLLDAARKDLLAGRLLEGIAGLEEVLKVEPAQAEAARQLAEARAALAQQANAQKETRGGPKEPESRPARPLSLPEDIKSVRPATPAQEDARPRRKPGELPK